MRKIVLALALMFSALFAEPTFDQIQNMIDKQEFKQAKLALTIVTQNHPDSAKAYYTLAQANAGLGDLIAAQSALDKAYSLNPALPFATTDQVEKLKKAIKPQVTLITKVEEPSHWFRNSMIAFIVLFLGLFGYNKFKSNCEKNKRKLEEEDDARRRAHREQRAETARAKREAESKSSGYAGEYTKQEANTGNMYVDGNTMYSVHQAGKPNEVHHHYHNDTVDNTGSHIASAAIGAVVGAGIAESMHNHRSEPEKEFQYERSYFEKSNNDVTKTSSSWNDDSEKVSKTWDEPTTSISKSWDDDSSSRSSSWGSSSSSDSYSSSSSSDSSSSWSD